MKDLESLDEDVKKFVAETLERKGVVTGWVLFSTSSRFDDDGNVLYAYDYTLGPDCDIARAIGLVEVGYEDLRRDIRPKNIVQE